MAIMLDANIALRNIRDLVFITGGIHSPEHGGWLEDIEHEHRVNGLSFTDAYRKLIERVSIPPSEIETPMRVVTPAENDYCSQCHKLLAWGIELEDPGEYPPDRICYKCLKLATAKIEADSWAAGSPVSEHRV
jgi:hypothetical protein